MRKVKITKQQTVNPTAVFMGLSIAQSSRTVHLCVGD